MNLDLGNIKIYLGDNTLILLYVYNYLLSTPSVDKPPDLIERVTNGIPGNGIPEIFQRTPTDPSPMYLSYLFCT